MFLKLLHCIMVTLKATMEICEAHLHQLVNRVSLVQSHHKIFILGAQARFT